VLGRDLPTPAKTVTILGAQALANVYGPKLYYLGILKEKFHLPLIKNTFLFF
jgi:hypothetical protein